MNLILTIGAQVFITGGFFVLTSLFYKDRSAENERRRKAFFKDLETPVIADATQKDYDRQQRHKLGMMVVYMGIGLCAMILIPNPLWGRVMFLLCALALLVIGTLLKKSATIQNKDMSDA